jgi:hypothetical protein
LPSGLSLKGAKGTKVTQAGAVATITSPALSTAVADIKPVGITAAIGVSAASAPADHLHQGTPLIQKGAAAGPYPVTVNFSTTYATARLVVEVSATAIKTTAVGFVQIDTSVDSGAQGTAGTYSNNFGVHLTCCTVYSADIVVAAGAHTLVISLNQGPGSSSSDANDRAYWRIVEYPKGN